jgi:hypothetical protein
MCTAPLLALIGGLSVMSKSVLRFGTGAARALSVWRKRKPTANALTNCDAFLWQFFSYLSFTCKRDMLRQVLIAIAGSPRAVES